MKLENQVSNVELSEELKKLGVPQNSLWYWYDAGNKFLISDVFNNPDNDTRRRMGLNKKDNRYYSAFTVAELGEMLPVGSMSAQTKDKWQAWYHNYTIPETVNQAFWANTEADARAKMLIYLIEQRIVKVENL